MKRLASIGLAAALAASLAAPAPLSAQPAPSGPVTVEFFALASGNWQPVIDDFQKAYPNITVKWTKFGTDEMKQALRVGASSGKMPDAWFNWGGSLASPYNRGGHALETTAFVKENKLDETLIPTALELAKDNGKLYGIPNRIVPMGPVYRKDVFEKHGLKPPQTFAELEKICETLKAAGTICFSTGGKFSWMTMRFVDYFIEHFAGPAQHDKLMAMQASWDSEPVVKSFAKLKEWVDKGYFNEGFVNLDPQTNLQLVYQGKAAMVFETASVETARMVREKVDLNAYGTFPAPTDHQPRRVSGFQQQIQVWAKAPPEVQKAALLFAAWVVRPDAAPKNMLSIGAPISTRGVMPSADLPMQTQWANLLQGEISLFLPTDQALPQQVVSAFFEAQDSVILGVMTPQDAAAQIEEAVQAYKAQGG